MKEQNAFFDWRRWKSWHHLPASPTYPIRVSLIFIHKIQGFLLIAVQHSDWLDFFSGAVLEVHVPLQEQGAVILYVVDTTYSLYSVHSQCMHFLFVVYRKRSMHAYVMLILWAGVIGTAPSNDTLACIDCQKCPIAVFTSIVLSLIDTDSSR